MGQVGRLGPKVGGHLALLLHSSREPGELSQCSKHHKHCRGYYYYYYCRYDVLVCADAEVRCGFSPHRYFGVCA